MKNYETNRVARTVSVAALAGVALTGCSELGNTVFEASENDLRVASAGFIPEGVNVRTDPNVNIDKEDGLTNSCVQLASETTFSATTVMETSGDANGPWVGFDITDLPESIQTSCANDADGIIWIAKEYVNADITPAEPLTARN